MQFLALISPDQALCHAIGEQLKQDSAWQMAVFASMEEALGAWSGALPPMILWDAGDAPMTREMTEFFLSRLRTAHPAPMLLVLGDVPDPLESFGVTEALTRPLRLGHLLSRLQFYQRLLQQAPDISLALGPWIFAPRARTLTARDDAENTIKLTDKETALLEYLASSPGAIPREELLSSVWGYDARIDTHTLETHIYRLRRKLGLLAADGVDVFLTEPGTYQINPVWRAS